MNLAMPSFAAAHSMAPRLSTALNEAVWQMFDHTDVAMALYDADDVLRHANAAFERRFLRGLPLPVSFKDVLRHGFQRGFGAKVSSGDIEAFIAEVLKRRGKKPFRAFEVDTVEGEWLWMTETRLPDGWMMSMASDVTSLKNNETNLRLAHDDAQIAARTDALTGAPNRRHILEAGEGLIRQCRELRLPCSLAVLDLDHFKSVNDTHGHAVGDTVLREFVAHCQPLLRAGDLLGRLGGEEFLLLLPTTRWPIAVAVCDRLRQCLMPLPLDGKGGELTYSFSAGVAEVQPKEDLATLMRRADEAMYRAKHAGRARTKVAAPE
jgi:diguanylate cyclase (GGDEF)-like protein